VGNCDRDGVLASAVKLLAELLTDLDWCPGCFREYAARHRADIASQCRPTARQLGNCADQRCRLIRMPSAPTAGIDRLQCPEDNAGRRRVVAAQWGVIACEASWIDRGARRAAEHARRGGDSLPGPRRRAGGRMAVHPAQSKLHPGPHILRVRDPGNATGQQVIHRGTQDRGRVLCALRNTDADRRWLHVRVGNPACYFCAVWIPGAVGSLGGDDSMLVS
jgi:hypothetical protein